LFSLTPLWYLCLMQNTPDAAGQGLPSYRRDCDAVSAALLSALLPLETRTEPVPPEAVLCVLFALLTHRAQRVDMPLSALERMLRAAYDDRAMRRQP
jgi:hypothetical protein